jgi:hypothetical protein
LREPQQHLHSQPHSRCLQAITDASLDVAKQVAAVIATAGAGALPIRWKTRAVVATAMQLVDVMAVLPPTASSAALTDFVRVQILLGRVAGLLATLLAAKTGWRFINPAHPGKMRASAAEADDIQREAALVMANLQQEAAAVAAGSLQPAGAGLSGGGLGTAAATSALGRPLQYVLEPQWRLLLARRPSPQATHAVLEASRRLAAQADALAAAVVRADAAAGAGVLSQLARVADAVRVVEGVAAETVLASSGDTALESGGAVSPIVNLPESITRKVRRYMRAGRLADLPYAVSWAVFVHCASVEAGALMGYMDSHNGALPADTAEEVAGWAFKARAEAAHQPGMALNATAGGAKQMVVPGGASPLAGTAVKQQPVYTA